jgi:hypothetical protein
MLKIHFLFNHPVLSNGLNSERRSRMKVLVTSLIVGFLLFTVQPIHSAEAMGSGSKSMAGDDSPIMMGTGGPDDYGYTWIDSDEPGGPTFQWVDITGIGTQVTGLTDDNSVGPFLIGFDFPYYWYTVDRFFIGSNGWISFSGSAGHNSAHPFARLPDSRPPNDLLCVLTGDIDYTKGGTCYYYTNSTDTLIVSWIEAPEFYPTPPSSHTFQVIITRADSSITYQYGEQIGNFSAGGSNAFSMGMENSTGTIGLNYFYNPRATPPPDPPPFADSTVILFTPPDSTAFVVNDIGVVNGLTMEGKGVFLHPDSSEAVWSDLKNFGNQTETAYGASAIIEDEGSATVYTDSIIVSGTPIAPSEVMRFDFTTPFVPGTAGEYTAMFGGHLHPGPDLVPDNDVLEVEVQAVTYPGVLTWDDNLADDGSAWSGDSSGYGNEFIPPLYPTKVQNTTISIFQVDAPGFAIVSVHDDDGLGGAPGTILASDTLFVNAAGMLNVDFSDDNVVIDEGGFFISMIVISQGTLWFGVDNNPPRSKRGWEMVGGWAPSRSSAENDLMIRAGVTYVFDTMEDVRADADGDFVPDMLGEEVFVSGILTGAAEHYGPDPAVTFFQDMTGGVGLVATEDDSFPDRTEIIVTGTVGQVEGVTVIENVSSLQFVRYSAPLPTPVSITSSDLADSTGEAFEGLFATLERVRILSDFPDEGEDGFVTVVDESGDTATVFIDMDTDIDGTTAPTDTIVNITGVVGQFAQETVPYDGYVLMPREENDIEFATGIGDGDEPEVRLPTAFTLSQNYPNPFNPSTTVTFEIPGEKQHVSLVIYDIRGRRVKTLVDGELEPGTYKVNWNGRDEGGKTVSSGIYLYTLRSNEGTYTRKMTVLK